MAGGQHWLITGVGSGLGKALAATVLADGHRVAGTVRREADKVAFEAAGPNRARGLLLDLADSGAIAAAVAEAEKAGGVDVLVNNAGYGLTGAIEEVSPVEARAQFEVNLFAPLQLIQAVLPGMRRRRAGLIVNITSVSGLATWQGTGIYCASKFALEAVGEALADEVAPLGIRVMNVAPGGMRTDYASRSLKRAARRIADYDATAHSSGRILAEHAGREPGDPVRIARHIVAAATMANPPLHLLLGADALHYATSRLDALRAEFDRMRAVTLDAGFDGPRS